MADKHYRSFIKAVSWRLTGSMDTMIISFLITGRIRWALTISGVELFTKIGLYYLHERIWERVPLGRIRNRRTSRCSKFEHGLPDGGRSQCLSLSLSVRLKSEQV